MWSLGLSPTSPCSAPESHSILNHLLSLKHTCPLPSISFFYCLPAKHLSTHTLRLSPKFTSSLKLVSSLISRPDCHCLRPPPFLTSNSIMHSFYPILITYFAVSLSYHFLIPSQVTLSYPSP